MKKTIILISSILIGNFHSFSQTNLYWKLGYHTGVSFKSGTCVVNPNDTCTMQMFDSNTGVSDNQGNLIFYSNGLLVKNRLDQTMPNGDNFNHGTVSDTYIPQGWMPPYNIATVIPFPNDTNKFYLFYENLEYSINGSDFPNKLRYLIVDKSLNSGLGDVTQKEIDVITDTLYDGQLHAIKHGNGKDYWLIARKYKSNIFYKVLINSSGVSIVDTQAIGNTYPVNNTVGIYSGYSGTSLMGDKIVYWYAGIPTTGSQPDGQLDIEEFDRCTGKFMSAKNIILPYSGTDTLDFLFGCISPNGKYLYSVCKKGMFQLDLTSSNILNSRFFLGNHASWNFGQMQIAPDNKIYCAGYGAAGNMHVINAPDSFGLACNFVQNQIYFGGSPHYSNGGLPNVPNFSLGAINCNVGIEDVGNENNGLNIYPNPASDELRIKSLELSITKVEVMDLLGRVMLTKVASANNLQLSIHNLSNGIYLLKVTDEKGNSITKKMVKE